MVITRDFTRGETVSSAVYSDCERYRYALTRTWDAASDKVLFIMLNPSKATEMQNDPTVERCERRARTLEYGAFRVANIFGLRETDPKKLRADAHPIGPDNDAEVARACHWADVIIAGWGTHGAYLGRGAEMLAVLRRAGQPLFHLGLTKDGHPRHPLYIAYRQQPELWPED